MATIPIRKVHLVFNADNAYGSVSVVLVESQLGEGSLQVWANLQSGEPE